MSCDNDLNTGADEMGETKQLEVARMQIQLLEKALAFYHDVNDHRLPLKRIRISKHARRVILWTCYSLVIAIVTLTIATILVGGM